MLPAKILVPFIVCNVFLENPAAKRRGMVMEVKCEREVLYKSEDPGLGTLMPCTCHEFQNLASHINVPSVGFCSHPGCIGRVYVDCEFSQGAEGRPCPVSRHHLCREGRRYTQLFWLGALWRRRQTYQTSDALLDPLERGESQRHALISYLFWAKYVESSVVEKEYNSTEEGVGFIGTEGSQHEHLSSLLGYFGSCSLAPVDLICFW
jgi:hypothetical protein